MGQGYIRNDTTNQISNGNVVDADALDGEFDAVVAAFNGTTGHSHDGTTGEGGPINVLGPSQDVTISAGQILPKTTNTVDLGSALLQFKDIHFSGDLVGTITDDQITGLGTAAVVNTGTGSSDVPTTSQADSRYLRQIGGTLTGNLLLSSADPKVTLERSDVKADFRRAELSQFSDGSVALTTRNSSNVFVSADYRIYKDALGAVTHRFLVANSEVARVDGGGLPSTLSLVTRAAGDLRYAPIDHVGAGSTAHAAVTTSSNGFMSSADKTKLDGIAAGAEANVDTDLSVTRNTTSVTVVSSTGDDAVLPAATTSLAGVLTADDKTKLNGIPTNGQVDLGTTVGSLTLSITSSTGSSASIPVSSNVLAGIITADDRVKFDGIEAGAQVNPTTTAARDSSSTTSVLQAKAMADHIAATDHDSVYQRIIFKNTSTAYTITPGSTYTWTHGLGGLPDPASIGVILTCTSADLGYSVGNVIYLPAGPYHAGTTPYGVTCGVTTTTIVARLATSGFYVHRTSDNAAQEIDPTKWTMTLYAQRTT